MATKKNDDDWRPPRLAEDEDKAPKQKPSKRTLERGWIAAVTLKPGALPLRCYIGQIQAFDDRAIRLSLLEPLFGTPSWDLYVPHDMIKNMLLGTDEHSSDDLMKEFNSWRTSVNRPEKENDAEKDTGSHDK
jgi:hypothetical protein